MLGREVNLMLAAALAVSTCAAQTATFANLYNFQGFPIDGQAPTGPLLLVGDGTLYGTTTLGGAGGCSTGVGCGVAYELKPPAGSGGVWTESLIYTFGAYPNAALPNGGVIVSSEALYGTSAGGANNYGAVFQLSPPAKASATWSESLIFSANFPATDDPDGPLLPGPDGVFYGTTTGFVSTRSGHVGGATVFVLTPPAATGKNWTESTLYTFLGHSKAGNNPRAGLISIGGALFGTDYYGGNSTCSQDGCGVVFEILPPLIAGEATESPVHEFKGPPLDGAHPTAPLTAGPDGTLYGTTLYGGTNSQCITKATVRGCGTVFQLSPPASPGGGWTETVLYSFTGLNGDGALPAAGVVVGEDGSLYGTTQYGGNETVGSPCESDGASGCGTAFRLTPPATPGSAWTELVLHSFSGMNGEGANPESPLLLNSSGVLYGTTYGGGSTGAGTLFSLTLN